MTRMHLHVAIRSGLRWMMIVAVFVFTACSSSTKKTNTLRVWHFWGEPAQKVAFLSLIDEYLKSHPGITIELTELSWTDGKAKLISAFASGTAPDIVHIGLEWVQEFAVSGVLRPVDSSLISSVPQSIRQGVQVSSRYYAVPWVMNTRALFVRNDVLERYRNQSRSQNLSHTQPFVTTDERDTLLFLSALRAACNTTLPVARIGVQSYEPHNVLKKVLPFLWSSGSTVFLSLPFSKSIDTFAIVGLQEYCSWADGGIIEPSRTLDMRLKRGELGMWVSGMWNLSDTAITNHYTVLARFPACSLWAEDVNSGASLVSADCFAVNAATSMADDAQKLLRFLQTPQVALRFCARIPDAGFPCTEKAIEANDSYARAVFDRPQARAFFKQTKASNVLPCPPYFLEAEEILEQEICEAVYGKKSPEQALKSAKIRLAALELSQSRSRQ